MLFRRRWLTAALALLTVAGTFALGTPSADAMTDKCPKGYKVVKKTKLLSDGKDSTKYSLLVLQKKGLSYCATLEHRGKAKGDPAYTQVDITFDRVLVAADPPIPPPDDPAKQPKYAHYAGPVIATAPKGTKCVDAVGNMWGKGSKSGRTYSEWTWTHDHRTRDCF